jgi:hypothetical protein
MLAGLYLASETNPADISGKLSVMERNQDTP